MSSIALLQSKHSFIETSNQPTAVTPYELAASEPPFGGAGLCTSIQVSVVPSFLFDEHLWIPSIVGGLIASFAAGHSILTDTSSRQLAGAATIADNIADRLATTDTNVFKSVE